MSNPTEENASTMEAFRVFDSEGRGFISTRSIREVPFDSFFQYFIKYFTLVHIFFIYLILHKNTAHLGSFWCKNCPITVSEVKFDTKTRLPVPKFLDELGGWGNWTVHMFIFVASKVIYFTHIKWLFLLKHILSVFDDYLRFSLLPDIISCLTVYLSSKLSQFFLQHSEIYRNLLHLFV